jgi:predicted ArsR family transcriptional regulator
MTRQSKPATKKAQLIQMLSRKAGADVAAISDKLGWLPHTTRAALSGLRNSGYELASEKPGNGKPSRYRITGKPAADAA